MWSDLVGDAEFLAKVDDKEDASDLEIGLAWAVLAARLELAGLSAHEAEQFARELEQIAHDTCGPVKKFALEQAIAKRFSPAVERH
ncbi:MAG: hypothetical protein JST54_35920 [Deltaproteobacteria bacterium]|nr:hypothetical protein [Deltaproteobacteria bacterium]